MEEGEAAGFFLGAVPKTAKFSYGDPGAPRPNRPIGVGVLALIERDGALLTDLRGDCGRWGLVGGALGIDESRSVRDRQLAGW